MHIEHNAVIDDSLEGQRLDQAVVSLFPDYSRSRLQKWIAEGEITVNGKPSKNKYKVQSGDAIVVNAQMEAQERWLPEPIALDVRFEDEEILVINKPAGMVVHPAAGNPDGTLLNGLLNHFEAAAELPRAGIVHRLDKDTTGLMVVAKTLRAQNSLVTQLQERTVSREYMAVSQGVMTSGGTVKTMMGRHPRNRLKQAVLEFGGKDAITHYRVEERFSAHTLVRCKLETGRTHQIRVHMAHQRFPLLGDPLYGGRLKIPRGASPKLIETLRGFKRQALHAQYLELDHPATLEAMAWECDLPEDMLNLLDVLETEVPLE